MSEDIITVGIADDHEMFRHSIVTSINDNSAFKVILEASHGKELIDRLKTSDQLPEILIIDIMMPIMDGYQTISYLKEHYPNQRCIAFSVKNDFVSVFKMIKNGAKAYIKKDCSTEQFFKTLTMVHSEGIYHDSFVANSLLEYVSADSEEKSITNELSERELEFISTACSDLTYKQVADLMSVSLRTVDSFRDSVFDKINVKSRAGMVLYAIKKGIFKI